MTRKRGGGIPLLPLEFETAESRYLLEPPTNETPDRIFDRRWAVAVLDRVMGRLAALATGERKKVVFEALKTYLAGDMPQLSYADTAAALGMSEGAVKVSVHRLRNQFRALIRDEIAHTVSSPEEIDDELQHLWSAVAR